MLKRTLCLGLLLGALGTQARAAGLWVSYDQGELITATLAGTLRSVLVVNVDGWLSPVDDDTQNGEHLGNLYCVDLYGHIPSNPTEFAVKPGITNLGWDDGNGRTNFESVAWLVSNTAGSSLTNTERNGLQVAIWSLAYANTFEYLDGLSSEGYDAYQSFLLAARNQGSQGGIEWYDSGSGAEGQDMIRAVPEPTGVWLLGSGILIGAAAWRRRRHA